MTIVETIRKLCKENKTSIAALERNLGFANGSIRKWDVGSPSYDRIVKVADALGVSVSDLTGESIKKEPTLNEGKLRPAMQDLMAAARDADDDLLAAVTKLLRTAKKTGGKL